MEVGDHCGSGTVIEVIRQGGEPVAYAVDYHDGWFPQTLTVRQIEDIERATAEILAEFRAAMGGHDGT